MPAADVADDRTDSVESSNDLAAVTAARSAELAGPVPAADVADDRTEPANSVESSADLAERAPTADAADHPAQPAEDQSTVVAPAEPAADFAEQRADSAEQLADSAEASADLADDRTKSADSADSSTDLAERAPTADAADHPAQPTDSGEEQLAQSAEFSAAPTDPAPAEASAGPAEHPAQLDEPAEALEDQTEQSAEAASDEPAEKESASTDHAEVAEEPTEDGKADGAERAAEATAPETPEEAGQQTGEPDAAADEPSEVVEEKSASTDQAEAAEEPTAGAPRQPEDASAQTGEPLGQSEAVEKTVEAIAPETPEEAGQQAGEPDPAADEPSEVVEESASTDRAEAVVEPTDDAPGQTEISVGQTEVVEQTVEAIAPEKPEEAGQRKGEPDAAADEPSEIVEEKSASTDQAEAVEGPTDGAPGQTGDASVQTGEPVGQIEVVEQAIAPETPEEAGQQAGEPDGAADEPAEVVEVESASTDRAEAVEESPEGAVGQTDDASVRTGEPVGQTDGVEQAVEAIAPETAEEAGQQAGESDASAEGPAEVAEEESVSTAQVEAVGEPADGTSGQTEDAPAQAGGPLGQTEGVERAVEAIAPETSEEAGQPAEVERVAEGAPAESDSTEDEHSETQGSEALVSGAARLAGAETTAAGPAQVAGVPAAGLVHTTDEESASAEAAEAGGAGKADPADDELETARAVEVADAAGVSEGAELAEGDETVESAKAGEAGGQVVAGSVEAAEGDESVESAEAGEADGQVVAESIESAEAVESIESAEAVEIVGSADGADFVEPEAGGLVGAAGGTASAEVAETGEGRGQVHGAESGDVADAAEVVEPARGVAAMASVEGVGAGATPEGVGAEGVEGAARAEGAVHTEGVVGSAAAGAGGGWLARVVGAFRGVLGDEVDERTGLYELGVDSVAMVRVHTRLQEVLGLEFPRAVMFEQESILALSNFLEERAEEFRSTAAAHSSEQAAPARSQSKRGQGKAGKKQAVEPIAIIGLAARLPGADTLEQFWDNLAGGVESLRRFTTDEVAGAKDAFGNEELVAVSGALDDVESFDAEFFGLSDREAELTDPAQRIFLEVCQHALEHGGHAGAAGRIGIFAGSGMNLYTQQNQPPDFLATRVAYRLGLTGPAIGVQAAWSSSLVAIHLACQALRSGDADLALAGAAAVHVPQATGYHASPESILSPTGHIRVFDAAADGTVGGNGVAAVLLKRLDQAVTDGDTVYAVIRGSAVSNESDQAELVEHALEKAGVPAESISYIEANATGTAVEDAREFRALASVLRKHTDKVGFCTIGSVKPNIGHLDSAAGMAGLIKTVLMLQHRTLVPTINHTLADPELPMANSPFVIGTTTRDWEAGTPLRAGVSALDAGGTSAHVILEEAPRQVRRGDDGPVVLPLSAPDPEALTELVDLFRIDLETGTGHRLIDLASTAALGRPAHRQRLAVAGSSEAELAEALSTAQAAAVPRGGPGPLGFAFTGQGAARRGMAAGLAARFPVFRSVLDECDKVYAEEFGGSLLELLLTHASTSEGVWPTETAQPALFAFEVALARLWQSFGVQPALVVGHSVGEYAALCVAGALSLADGVRLTAKRGELMQRGTVPGAMVAVRADADRVRELAQTPGVEIAAGNGPQSFVLTGTEVIVGQLAEQLDRLEVSWQRLDVDRAFHSSLVDPILADFAEVVAQISLRPLRMPMVSSWSGELLESGIALDSDYLVGQLRQPVLFGDAVEALTAAGCRRFLELGPDAVLSPAGRRIAPNSTWIPAQRLGQDPVLATMNGLAELYEQGTEITWSKVYPNAGRVPLPLYPFRRVHHPVDTTITTPARGGCRNRARGTGRVRSCGRISRRRYYGAPGDASRRRRSAPPPGTQADPARPADVQRHHPQTHRSSRRRRTLAIRPASRKHPSDPGRRTEVGAPPTSAGHVRGGRRGCNRRGGQRGGFTRAPRGVGRRCRARDGRRGS
ncbi:acyltransferase domain-containing protein [Kribbella qitaiheensis]|uniref:Acyltransferase domain-containing protein n=1 Tax=Kribbella qitaiheensis TaxID=1544730 RepID=A0A7G6X6J8_9ACTN|nr:acyltransferase domain-containing protein [Kribbella qitaiheensis]